MDQQNNNYETQKTNKNCLEIEKCERLQQPIFSTKKHIDIYKYKVNNTISI